MNVKILFFVLVSLFVLTAGCVSQPPQAGQSTSGNSTLTTFNSTGGADLKVEKGDVVAVDYVGTFDDGKVFDTSIQAEAVKAKLPPRPSYAPLEFTVGAGQMIKGFDNAVYGMKEGDVKNVHLNASDAYGPRDDNLVITANRSQLNGNPKVGDHVSASNGATGTIVNLTNETITVDFNSEMAGKDLNFKIIMRKITKATK